MTVTNKKFQKEIKSGLNSEDVYYHAVQNILSSRLLSKILKIKVHKTLILPVILCGCKNLFLAIKLEHSLRVSEYRLLKRIFGPKREEVAGGWRRLHDEELHNFYTSPNAVRMKKSRRMRWEEMKNVYVILV